MTDKLPFRCGPKIKRRKWRGLPVEKLTRAERAMKFIETYCYVPEGSLVGQKVQLIPAQEDFIYAVLDNPAGTRRGILSIARKNAKTATIAMLLLVFLVGPEATLNSQIASGARSREQASQVFNYAEKMVLMNPALEELVRITPSNKTLIGLPMNVTYKAGSAEAKTAMGGSPVLAILDEVGQVRGSQDDFVDAITTSQGAHDNPLLLVISTQAADDADLLSIWIDDAERSQDPRIVAHVYTADEVDPKTNTKKVVDVLDKKAWKKANPALGIFRNLEDLAEQAKQAARMPSAENSFRNLCLNQRVSVVSPFVSQTVWKTCSASAKDFGDAEVWGGLDLSARTDLTSLVLIGRVGGIWQIKPYFWTPEEGLKERSKRDRTPYDLWVREGYLFTTPGKSVDYEFVLEDIMDITSGLNLQTIGYDRWRIESLKKEMDRLGIDAEKLPLVEFGQGYKDMAPAVDAIENELLNARMAHGMHPVLTMCAANAVVVKDPAGSRKLDKSKSTGRIDGMVALVMAGGVANMRLDTEEPISGEIRTVDL
jgi:phage terminase large subunit-like protein